MKRRSPVVGVRLLPPPLTASTEAELLKKVGEMMLATRPKAKPWQEPPE